MKSRKQEIRSIILDIIQGKEKVEYPWEQFPSLKADVAQVLERRAGTQQRQRLRDPKLSEADAMIVMEVFWDLVVEKVITIGLNESNPNFPWFRLHSEAQANLKSML